jgi:hypothetical protein
MSRVLRGGSWNNNLDNSRAANRNNNAPDNRNDNNGFRVVRALPQVRCVTRAAGCESDGTVIQRPRLAL